jgi:Tol biopolymer transport system component
VEFPVGTIVHEARAAWSLRVSPDGNRIAFFEGPQLFGNAPEAMVRVIDRSGHKLTLSRNWAGIGLAWAPSGKEVWFTATHGGAADPAKLATTESRTGAPWLVAVSLSGAERTVYRAPDWLVLHDIAPDGRVLLARNTIRIGLACQPRGEASERDLSWQLASVVSDLSPDGRWVTFHDTLGGRTPNGNPTVFRRNVDGSAAVPLGEGVGATVSPDGRWALARRGDSLVLLPTGAGSTVTLPKGSLTQVLAGAWLDSRRIVLTGRLGDGGPRVYVQEIPGGTPRPITPEGVTMSPKAAIRNDNWILARSGDEWRLYSIAGGEPQPVRVLTAQDVPVQWSDDGRVLYLVERVEGARSPGFNVFGLELATGRRVLWKKIAPSDPVGAEDQRERFALTPDAQSYCYSYVRRLGDLFVVRGLQ